MPNTNTETHEPYGPPEADYRKTHCSKCGHYKFKSEFAWMKRRMERKARCKDCSGFVYPPIGEPETKLKSPEDARSELEVILSKELKEAHTIQDDHYCGSTYLALIDIVPPLALSPRRTVTGLPVTTPPKVFKQHMVYHFDDDHLLPRILRSYEVAREHRASAMRDKRAAAKASQSKGSRACLHCQKPIDDTADARKKFCRDACRKAHSRSGVRETV